MRESIRPTEGWLALLALTGVLLTPIAAVVAAAWVNHLSLLYLVALAGLLLGLAFSRSGWSGLVLHPVALLIGGALTIDLVASTLPLGDRIERWERLAGRLFGWLRIVVTGGTGTDNLLFLLLLAALAWLIAYYGTWAVFRRGSAWFPLVAAGAALLLNVTHAPDLRGYVLVYAFACLILIVRLNMHAHEQRWRASGLTYARSVHAPALRMGVLVAGLLSALAWLVPQAALGSSWQQMMRDVTQPWEDAKQEFGRAFAGVPARSQNAISGFNSTLTLKGQFKLPETPVLRLWASEGRYLRAITYERYTGKGWVAQQATELIHWPPGDSDAPARGDDAREEFQQRVQVLVPRGNFVLAASEPIRASIPSIAERPRLNNDGSGGARRPATEVDTADLVALRSNDIRPGLMYDAVSRVSRASELELRQAGQHYPTQIASRYLALPGIPSRVRELAKQITDGRTNPYDQAKVIESYMHTYPYTLEVPPPPAGRDGVDYFLFDAKAGYCDYFASSMVVMLRSLGIPARVVSGYAVGERESPAGPFLVRDSTAHTWVEVYFPRYGWIEFEPSSNRPTFQRPPSDQQGSQATPSPASGTPTAGPSGALPTPTASSDRPQDQQVTPTPTPTSPPSSGTLPPTQFLRELLDQSRIPALILLAVATLSAVVYLLWRRGSAGLLPIERVYAELCRLASLVGRGPRPWQTPREYTDDLGQIDAGLTRFLRRLGAAFAATRYGGQPPPTSDEVSLATGWRESRWRLFWALVRMRLRG